MSAHDKTYNKTCVASKDSDRPVHLLITARVLVHPSLDSLETVEGACDQWRHWSACTNAQADLSLRLSHKSYCRFCRGLAQLFCAPFGKGFILKGNNLIHLGAFFPSRIDPFSEGARCSGKQTGSHRSCLLQKMADNAPYETSLINTIQYTFFKPILKHLFLNNVWGTFGYTVSYLKAQSKIVADDIVLVIFQSKKDMTKENKANSPSSPKRWQDLLKTTITQQTGQNRVKTQRTYNIRTSALERSVVNSTHYENTPIQI